MSNLAAEPNKRKIPSNIRVFIHTNTINLEKTRKTSRKKSSLIVFDGPKLERGFLNSWTMVVTTGAFYFHTQCKHYII